MTFDTSLSKSKQKQKFQENFLKVGKKCSDNSLRPLVEAALVSKPLLEPAIVTRTHLELAESDLDTKIENGGK